MRTPHEIREYILYLLKKKNTSVNKMLVECGYNTSLVNDLKKGQMPSADKIATIAKYLGISTDALIGNQDNLNKIENTNELDYKEVLIADLRRIIYETDIRGLSREDIENIVEIVKMILRLKEGGNSDN